MLTETIEKPQDSEREILIQAVERQLAAGVPLVRLSNVTSISVVILDALLRRERLGYGLDINRDHADAIDKLRKWQAESTRNTESNRRALVETPTYKSVTNLLRLAHEEGRIVAITGGFGIGKSEAAKAYALANPMNPREPGALRVEFTATDKKPTAALAAVGEVLRRDSYGRPAYRNGNIMNQICGNLRTGDVLLLDEYNHLEGDAINIARDLHQRAEVGVAMIGNPDFSRKVWGKSEEFAALANRALRFDFPANTVDDVDVWLNWKGYLGAKLRNVAIKVGTKAGRNGGLRSVNIIFENMHLYPDYDIDDKLFEQVATKLGRW